MYKRDDTLCISIKGSGHLESSLVDCGKESSDTGLEDKVRAEIVNRMKELGYTYDVIAEVLGFKSLGSITKLLKRAEGKANF